MDYIIGMLPRYISNEIIHLLNSYTGLKENIQEIKLRVSRPIILKQKDQDYIINHIVTSEEILLILERFCENSIYAYKKQICEGFLTIKGGHRIGIVGNCVIEDNRIINIKYISSLNIRIAKQIIGCSNKIIDEIIDINNQSIANTLIVSPPGKGKTTVLRDLVRQISNGIDTKNFKGKTVGLIDERGEIAACFRGTPQNDVGIRTDILENVSKIKGIEMLLRSMAPEVIACDEIGTKDDTYAIQKMLISGVKGIFTMHGSGIEDVKKNIEINKLIENKDIEKIIII